MILQEIGTNILPGLNEIDELFNQLKLATTGLKKRNICDNLEIKLKEIFHTEFIIDLHFLGSESNNMGVLPIYKNSKDSKIELGEDFIKLISLRKIYIVVGQELIDKSTPRELTAILLHEIGHITEHTSISMQKFYNFIYPIYKISDPLSKIPFIGLPALAILLITSRSLSWIDHVGEYNADKFVIQYGYGDELANVIHKWHKEKKKYDSTLTFIDKLMLLGKLFRRSSHPDYEKRVKEIVNEIKEKYESKYKLPKLNKLLDEYNV